MVLRKKFTSIPCDNLWMKIKNQMDFILLLTVITNSCSNTINTTSKLSGYKNDDIIIISLHLFA